MKTAEQRKEFDELSKHLIKWLNDNCNPHTIIVIDTTSAELLSSELAIRTNEFIKD